MWREVLITQMGQEVLLAVVEDDRLVELHTDLSGERPLLGNIYKGRVKCIVPGMDAAFIDIGERQDGFLYVTDVHPVIFRWMYESTNGVPATRRVARPHRIHEVLREGDTILVQVKREAIQHKAPRVSTKIALTGTYLVYMPTHRHVGVSSRIVDPDRRKHLKQLGQQWIQRRGGLIFRTASASVDENVLYHEWQMLTQQWECILQRAREHPAPYLLYREPPMLMRLLRDLLSPYLRRIWVDQPEMYEQVHAFLMEHAPEWLPFLHLYRDTRPLFYRYGIQKEIRCLFRPKVWLKSGAYLVINQTEALVTIDVNTGKNIGRTHFQESVLSVNLEAVREIVRQIRLRNLSGLILIDFIDMEPPQHWERLRDALEQELRRDRIRSYILPQSSKSLVLMTRQKTQVSLLHQLGQVCMHCGGDGFLYSPRIIAWEIIWKLMQIRKGLFQRAVVRANPRVIELLRNTYRDQLRGICRRIRAEIELRDQPTLQLDQYDLTFY